jgi:hypothetical protein
LGAIGDLRLDGLDFANGATGIEPQG